MDYTMHVLDARRWGRRGREGDEWGGRVALVPQKSSVNINLINFPASHGKSNLTLALYQLNWARVN